MAPTGLLLSGAGLSLVGEATVLKASLSPWWEWFAWGTLGLILFNVGLCIFTEAVKRLAVAEAVRRIRPTSRT